MKSIDSLYTKAKINYFHNPNYTAENYPEALNPIISSSLCDDAIKEISQWENYTETPLHNLDNLTKTINVSRIDYKDESTRFGLGSFKALGGAYAVLIELQKTLTEQLNEIVTLQDIRNGKYQEHLKNITIVTATDGNHGRSVAWGCQSFGCACKIYIHKEVSEGRKTAMESFGAEVIRVQGNYEDSVQEAEKSRANGWILVSDTSYPGYTEVPRFVMAGYTVMIKEALQQLQAQTSSSPTHIFVQGGCGGLPAAICAYLWLHLSEKRPRFIVVEPKLADCLIQSAMNNRPTLVDIQEESIMAGLSCGEVSSIGWDILSQGTNDFLAIDDNLIAPTMQSLAKDACSKNPIVGGESAVAGLAALIATTENAELSQSLGIDQNSHILILGTEGATDPEIYQQLVGKTAAQVLA
jgi:diaminopropionate ammonia-lyase